MLERGLAAKKARSVFFEERNTIDVYIEDTAKGYKKIYKCILNRLIGEKFVVSDVFPLGGKSHVLKAWKSDTNKRNRPRVYIVDGDLSLFFGERLCGNGLYTLPYYCLENVFICKESLLQILVEEDPEREYTEINELLNFDEWINKNSRLFFDLFIMYALISKYNAVTPTINYSISNLIDDMGDLDSINVNQRINELELILLQKYSPEFIKEKKEEINNTIEKDFRIKKFISGKDYLLPLILARMRSIVNIQASGLSLKHRISKNCNLDDLTDIENSILL